jgi:pSer/pThr/pTyr-binding forkhead associated (FHA) protein
MSKDHEDRIDPRKPGLIVRYGSTKRKFRPLEADLIVLGRAPGCDIGLVSPEVAPVHCILVRVAEGWRVRDCSGRGTRVNGKSIRDEPLRNGDAIQVGTFSFEAQLPPGAAAPSAMAPLAEIAPDTERLQQSRRRLAELALGLRRRLREQAGDRAESARQQADLEQLERRLRKAHEEQMARQTKLAAEQKELTRRSEELDRYAAHLRRQAAEAQDDAGEQARQLEAELVKQRVEQNRLGEQLARARGELEARQAELEEAAEQLAEALKGEREQLDRDRQQVDRERGELTQQRIELERLKERLAQQTPMPASTRETQLDVAPGDKLESARKLLRDLADRRKATAASGARPRNSRARQPRPQVEGGSTHEPRTK